jgi:transcriptional regulator with XRE-family HTH domain
MPASPHKKRLVIPAWFLALDMRNDTPEVYGAFRAVLDMLPISMTELARRLGVTQPTVSRWASGAATPSLEDMVRVIETVAEHTAELQERVSRSQHILALVEKADELHRKRNEAKSIKTKLKYNHELTDINDALYPFLKAPWEEE